MTGAKRSVHMVLAACILVIGLWGFLQQTRTPSLPPNPALARLAWPATVAGITVNDLRQLEFVAEGFQIGEQLAVEPATGSPLTVILVRDQPVTYLIITLISGLFFWIVAAFIFLPRMSLPAASHFYWITSLYGLAVLIGGVYFQSTTDLLSLIPPIVQLLCLAILPAAFLHLSTVFPVALPLVARRPRLPRLLYVLAAVLILWQAWAFLRYFVAPGPVTAAGLDLPQRMADTLLVLQVAAGLLILVAHERRLKPTRERQQVRWLLVGFAICSAPYVFLRTLPQIFGIEPVVPVFVDRLLEPAVPLAFVFAVVRYRLLDIDIIIRRGLIYGLLAGGLVSLILLPVVIMGYGWTGPWPEWVRVVPAAGALIAGLFFQPLRTALGNWVDRIFFRIEHEVDAAVRRLRQDLARVSGQRKLADRLHRRVCESVSARQALTVVTEGKDVYVAGRGWSPAINRWLDEGGTTTRLATPDAVADPVTVFGELPQELQQEGFVLAQPLVLKEESAGVILLGPREPGHRYVDTDLGYLAAAARLAARRLGEIRLIQTVAAEQLKRRQVDELGRLKDEFLSRVAHDLRTPVTSLGWSARNLLDGLPGELNERQRDYLESMQDAVNHLDGLVSGLLEISRLERAKVEIPTGPCRLAEVLNAAVGTVRPLADARQVQIALLGHEEALPVLANRDKLAEVVVNILENAVRYSSPQGRIEITVHTSQEQALFTIRDHGPGLGELVDPFGRFVQGTPSPHGEGGGYGLGLTIAAEYIQLMGGSITAADHPDGGAMFTVELSTAGQAQEERHGS